MKKEVKLTDKDKDFINLFNWRMNLHWAQRAENINSSQELVDLLAVEKLSYTIYECSEHRNTIIRFRRLSKQDRISRAKKLWPFLERVIQLPVVCLP